MGEHWASPWLHGAPMEYLSVSNVLQGQMLKIGGICSRSLQTHLQLISIISDKEK